MGSRVPIWWDEAHEVLLNDELLGPVVKEHGPTGISSREDLFQTLVRSIVGQQISVTAADAIWGRLCAHLGEVTPHHVLATDQPSIAACGVTRPKASYIYGLAEDAERLMGQPWETMSDLEIQRHLVSFRGIGPWTAEMFGMFYLLEKDIFPIKDIGIIRAMNQVYGNEGEALDLNETKAYFVCVLVLVQVSADPYPLIATGLLEGSVKTTMQGANGFGYDPMFYPKESNLSLGEMNADDKALLSHRGKAIQVLKRKIEGFASE